MTFRGAIGALLFLGFIAYAQDSGRIRPPGPIACDRNHLTSFTGSVTHYRHTSSGIWLTVRTDEATTEKFRQRGDRSRLERQFLLRGEPFRTGDWKRLETAGKQLRPGMRATVWVCEKPVSIVVDWQPPRD